MTKSSRRLHSLLLSVTFSILVWIIVSKYLFPIKLWQFIIIEIVLAIGEVFSTFVKAKLGVITEVKPTEDNGL